MFSEWEANIPRLLGEGAFGAVFKWKSPVGYLAIKLLRNYGIPSSQLSVYFKDEWQLLESLGFHENIAQLLYRFTFKPPLSLLKSITDVSLLDNVAPINEHTQQREPRSCSFLGLEYFSEGTLQSYLSKVRQSGQWSVSRLLEICYDIAKGVKFLFDQRIVHRDMKLDNLLVTRSGVVALCDFGLALQLPDQQMIARLSISDAKGGNINHLAPEVRRAKANDNQEVEIPYKFQPSWELGVLFFEISFDSFPFDNIDKLIPPDVRNQAQQHPSGMTFPEEFLDLIQRCLCVDQPSSRPTVKEICSLLESIKTDLSLNH